MIELMLIGASYVIGSFLFNSGWDDNQTKYDLKASTSYSKSVLNYIEDQRISEETIKVQNFNFSQNNISVEFNRKNTINHQLSFISGFSNLSVISENIYNYETLKIKDVKSDYKIIMLDSSLSKISAFRGIKPIVYLNLGILHLDKKESIYNDNNTNSVVSIDDSTTVATLLDTKIKLLWKGVTLIQIPHPIMFSEIGITFKQNKLYPYFNLGGYYELIDQFIIQAQWGLKPIYSKSNSLVGNASLSIAYKF